MISAHFMVPVLGLAMMAAAIENVKENYGSAIIGKKIMMNLNWII